MPTSRIYSSRPDVYLSQSDFCKAVIDYISNNLPLTASIVANVTDPTHIEGLGESYQFIAQFFPGNIHLREQLRYDSQDTAQRVDLTSRLASLQAQLDMIQINVPFSVSIDPNRLGKLDINIANIFHSDRIVLPSNESRARFEAMRALVADVHSIA